MDADRGAAERDAAWLADAIGRPVRMPGELYARESAASVAAVAQAFGVPLPAPAS